MSFYPPTTLPPLGCLCLDYTDDIHRPPGDPLNELSFQFPLIHEQVADATVQNVVFNGEFSERFLENFGDACTKLAERGAIGVITSCGFLAQVQQKIQSKSPIPVATSSLLQIPFVLSLLPVDKKVAVLTFDAKNLSPLHFKSVGVSADYQQRIRVFGCKNDGHLKGFIIGPGPYIHESLESELVELARVALDTDPSIGAFVLECTQMPPSSRAIQRATGLPVFDAITMIDHFYTGLKARCFVEDEFKEDGLRLRTRSEKETGK